MRIGILGGTFDPVHTGHIALARAVTERCGTDKILFIPNANPPHKLGIAITPYEHRVRMLEIALEDCDKAELCEVETQGSAPNYSVDTVRRLKALYGEETKFFFVIGSDEVAGLADWKDLKKLLAAVDVLVVSRAGWGLVEIDRITDSLGEDAVEKLKSNAFSVDLPDVSSTDIRQRAASGGDVANDVPPGVARYILEQGLYLAGT